MLLISIIRKELREHTRCQFYYVTNALYIILTSCLIFGMVWWYTTAKKAEPQYTLKIFSTFFILLILSINMICPAFTVGAISMEREKLTINLLRTTQLKYYHIFFGKLFSTILHILTLLSASIPIIILVIPIINISITKILLCYLIAFVSGTIFVSIGLIFSSVFKTRMSAVSTYIIIGIFNFCTLIIPAIATKIYKLKVSDDLLMAIKTLSPFFVIINVINDKPVLMNFVKLPIWGIMSIIYLLILIIVILIFIFISKFFQKDVIL